jgi:hypothetical protein
MFSSVEYWRDKADEVRAIANCMKDEETRRMMAKLANDYDRLAHHAERQKDHPPPSDARAGQAVKALLEAHNRARCSAFRPYIFGMAREHGGMSMPSALAVLL